MADIILFTPQEINKIEDIFNSYLTQRAKFKSEEFDVLKFKKKLHEINSDEIINKEIISTLIDIYYLPFIVNGDTLEILEELDFSLEEVSIYKKIINE